ncbi:hypothetical protein LTR86_002210 [Recurvomyces mirabilis]|nr:hypothetical protein LTR86_002210 [Recurvomyces mirabilis]
MFLPFPDHQAYGLLVDLERALGSAQWARIVARVIFIVLSLYLAVIGSACYGIQLKLKLLKTHRVPIVHTAGWLTADEILDQVHRLRCIPNLRWWVPMAVFALLSRVADVSTATIQPRPNRNQTCRFDTGMVLSPDDTTQPYTWTIPPAHTKGQMWATNAQLISLAHGCDMGIYSKVGDNWSFCARQTDIWGSWTCKHANSHIYPAVLLTPQDVVQDLVNRTLLYPGASPFSAHNQRDMTRSTQLVAWSNSLRNATGLFEVKACIDQSQSFRKPATAANVYATETRNIMNNFSPASTLDQWLSVLQGAVYNGSHVGASSSSGYIERNLTLVLNSMIMVAGSSDDLSMRALEGDDGLQGCLLYPTWIPDWLIGLSIGFVTTCIAMTIYYAILQYQLHHRTDRDLIKHMPIGPWEWMAQAVVEAEHTDNIRKRDLKKWYIVPNGHGSVQIEHRRTAAVNHRDREEDKDVEMKPLTAEHEEEPAVTPLEQLNMDVRSSM